MNEYPRNNHPNDPRNNPHEEQSPTWRALDGLSRYEPDAKDATRALDKAKLLLQQSQRGSQNVPRSRRWLMRLSAAAAMVLVVMFIWTAVGPEGGLSNPTWADVLKQTKDVRVAKLDVRSYQGKTLESRQEMYLQAPSTLRLHEYEYEDGREVETEGEVITPDGGVRWNAKSRVAERVEPDNVYVTPAYVAKNILGMLGMAVQLDTPEVEIKINQTRVRFEPVASPHPIEPSLRGYQLKPIDPDDKLDEHVFEKMTFWFDGSSNSLMRMSNGDYEGQWHDVVVVFEPELPADFFDVKAPEGYANVSDGLRARLPDDVRDVYDKAAAAKEAFGDYRALIWSRRQGWGLPIYVESRRGKQWRTDWLAWADGKFNAFQKSHDVEPDEGLDDAWSVMMDQGFKPEMSTIRFGDRFASVHYNVGGRGPRISASIQETLISHEYDRNWCPALLAVAWPEWRDIEVYPHGRDIQTPVLAWRVLPRDDANPQYVDIVGERDANSRNYMRYTFDEAHDYVCIRREQEEHHARVEGWLVLELAQTTEGKWYPKRVATYTRQHDETVPMAEELDTKYTYLVESGESADESFFAWPEGVPQPVDLIANLRPRRFSPAEKAAETKDYPPTALGKYTFFGSNGRGLPRGFDDEATSQAHWQMTRVMRDIEEAVGKYKPDHNWNYPQSLDELIEGGYITREAMQNPLHPDADPPFVYIHIARNLPNGIGRMMLYEPFDTWPGVVTVMFGDGSFEAIHDEGEFNALIEAATSPEDPKRYGE